MRFHMSQRLPVLMSVLIALLAAAPLARAQDQPDRPPNIVIVFTDDQGYADVGVFGAKGFQTPHLDQMAAEGMKFTSFYVAQAVCSASRAALLTGCYPNRIGISGALGPAAKHGIHEDEVTLAEICKQKDYATAIYGKWHLGHHKKFLPVHHGFDDYYGLPYSNDMWPWHPNVVHLPFEQRLKRWPHLPMVEDDEVIDPIIEPAEQPMLTTDYTERAVKFIRDNKDRPFLLYVAHSMPHVPLYVSDKFKGKSKQGLYGDVISEIDWSVGRITDTLHRAGVYDNTLMIFTSDNGPWLSYGNHAGSASPLREGKGTTWEGGARVPCIMRWPAKIPAGRTCNELAATIDVLPTVAGLIGAKLPDHRIDGMDISPLMLGRENATSPHEAYWFYWGRELQAIRSGKWKLHFPHAYRSLTGTPGKDGLPDGYSQQRTDLALYDLESDIGETTDVKDQHPDIVERLKALAEKARAELGDSATNQSGSGVREAGRL